MAIVNKYGRSFKEVFAVGGGKGIQTTLTLIVNGGGTLGMGSSFGWFHRRLISCSRCVLLLL